MSTYANISQIFCIINHLIPQSIAGSLQTPLKKQVTTQQTRDRRLASAPTVNATLFVSAQ
jgi:hypothetical protein